MPLEVRVTVYAITRKLSFAKKKKHISTQLEMSDLTDQDFYKESEATPPPHPLI